MDGQRALGGLRAASVCVLLSASAAAAQESTTYERRADGLVYKVTRTTVDRVVPTTQMQTREEKTYQPQTTTRVENRQQTYLTPVTQYRWVSRMKGRWNPFAQPYWKHELEPVTQWQSTQATVQTPVSSTQWVEQRRTVQVPVTTYRTAKEEYVTSVPVDPSLVPTGAVEPRSLSPDAGVTSVASRPSAIGGARLQSDPPRAGSAWQSSDGRYRR